MKNNNYSFIVFVILVLASLFYTSKSSSDEITKFLSLKNDEVNLRQGPSFDYPVKLIYKKKNLPVKIIDKLETWRKIIDFEKNSGWVHISQLSKKKAAINIKNNSIMYKKKTIYSKPIAKLEKGRLVLIKECEEKWCKISSGKFKGWFFKKNLWGKFK